MIEGFRLTLGVFGRLSSIDGISSNVNNAKCYSAGDGDSASSYKCIQYYQTT